MNLLKALVYMAGLAWWAGEGMARVGEGSWLFLSLFFAVFIVGFVMLGCLDADPATVERWGAVFGVLVTLGLLGLALTSFGAGGAATGVVKLVLAIAFGALALTGFRGRTQSPTHSAAH